MDDGVIVVVQTLFRLRTAPLTKKFLPKYFLANSIIRDLLGLREQKALRELPVYPVFEDEKSNGSIRKRVKRKIAYKKNTGLTKLAQTWFESK